MAPFTLRWETRMRRIRTPSFTNPFLAWTRLAWKTGEMMLASAQVIQQRTSRMAAAGTRPSARDRREFALMGQEKIEASVESASAMAAQMMAMNPLLGTWAVKDRMAVAAALTSLAASRTAGQAMARQVKLVRTMTQSAGATAKLSGAAARLAQHGLKPIHSRATANAKRLGRR